MTILVTGGTGSIGRRLVSALTAGGESVRALGRTPHPDPFAGVDRMFVFPYDGVQEMVTAAADAGVRRFVVLSSLAAAGEFPRDVRSVSYTHHRAIEQAVTEVSAAEWTILRPGTFATNLLAWAWPIRAGLPVRAPYLASAQAPVHEADIADAAAAVLTGDGHEGAIYPLTGPQSLTRAEQVAVIGAGLGRDIPVTEITPDEFRAEAGRHVPDGIVDMLLAYWSETVAVPDRVRSGVPDLTGRPGRTLAEWAHDHRADFL
jgi:uncharacterized protein YbjT (DUF2867 family)